MEEWVPHLANLGGVLVIAVLLVWRIDARLAQMESGMRDLYVAIEKLLSQLEG
jgi:hypothetical protein